MHKFKNDIEIFYISQTFSIYLTTNFTYVLSFYKNNT